MRTFPNICYICRLNNHKYQDCGILNKWKKAASANFELAKFKQGGVQAKRAKLSIPDFWSNNI